MKVVDRSIRSLVGLKGASTARVLNLMTISRDHAQEPEYIAKPLFRSHVLNTSIILKHRLRDDELFLFENPVSIATKIIFPFDKNDLASGGQSLCFGQRSFNESVAIHGGYGPKEDLLRQDLNTLKLIDSMPSLDPFILREYLMRHDIDVAECYFNISEADRTRMQSYVTEQVRKLSQMAAGDSSRRDDTSTSKLAASLLSNTVDERLEPLRKAFGLQTDEFREGAFAWRGFLYYKWRNDQLTQQAAGILDQIRRVIALRATFEQKQNIAHQKRTVTEGVRETVDAIRAVIARYDTVYDGFTQNQDPKAFCDFLLKAPELFMELGEMVGSLEHIVTYWRFRFSDETNLVADANELESTFNDFSQGFRKPVKQAPRAA